MSKEMRQHIDTFKQRILKENKEFNENNYRSGYGWKSLLGSVGDKRRESLLKQNPSESKKEKCWVIRNLEGNVMWVHKTMSDEQMKDYRRQGLHIEEHMLLD